MTLFNYLHYLALTLIFLLFVVGIVKSLQQKKRKLLIGMVFSVTIISIFFAIFSVIIIDKYTKKVELYQVKNKRLLGIEKIIYTGIVKNEGDFTIGKVVFEVKLVNKGHATGKVKGGDFYKPNGLFDFIPNAKEQKAKPQTITKKFIVARNLKPGTSKSFRVYFSFPPYFRSVADFTKVSGY